MCAQYREDSVPVPLQFEPAESLYDADYGRLGCKEDGNKSTHSRGRGTESQGRDAKASDNVQLAMSRCDRRPQFVDIPRLYSKISQSQHVQV